MEVRCDKCQARYRVDDGRIGPQGLTMRCGKCQNTFRVTRSPAAQPAGGAPQEAPSPAPAQAPSGNATMIFAAPSAAPKPPPRPAAAAPPTADEAAGRTMMFPSAPAPKPAAAAPAPAPPARPKQSPEPSASGTVVFSQPPKKPLPAQPPPVSKPAMPPPAGGEPRSTMIFAASQGAQKATIPPSPPQPPSPTQGAQPPAPAEARAGQERVAPPPAAEETADEAPEGSEESEAGHEPGPFDKAPPRGLLIGVAAGLVLLLVIGGALVAYRRLARPPPPPAAVEMLTSAQADAAQDTLASLASAETKARDSLDLAGTRARFPEATATLARIEIQWADALNDESALLGEQNADDAKVAQLQEEARAKLKSAFDLLAPAAKANRGAPELQLALADYYRGQRSPSNMSRYLKPFKDDPRAALIQGMALLQEDEGAERAIPRLKAALAADPQSARVHFRLALAYASAKDEANARAEAQETLRLSPRHERAQALLQRLGNPGAAEKK